MGQKETQRHNEGESPHSLRLQTPLGSTAREVTPSTSQTLDQLDTANVPAQQVVMCLVNNCHKLAWVGHGAKPMGSGTRMTNFCVMSQPTLLIASRKPYPRNLLQVVYEPNLRWSNACLNFRHLDCQSAGYLERVMATTTVYPRLFEISITLTSRAGYLERVIDTATVYSRWFDFLTTLTFKALHGHLTTLRES